MQGERSKTTFTLPDQLDRTIASRLQLLQAWSFFSDSSNLSFRIQNPLAGLSRNALLARVDEFAEEQGLTDIVPLLRKGALVAQDPTIFESIEDLELTELEALRNETLHKWRQPKALYMTVILCSVGACVQ